MRRKMARASAFLTFAFCLLPSAFVSVQQSTGAIGGVITDTAGQPARRARVTLNSAERGAVARTTTTDDAGRFAFGDLPAGRFSLQASKPGHLTTNYGARRPDRPGTPITLALGERVTNIAMTLSRGAVITGRVLDQGGQPAPGVGVSILRFGYSSLTGERTLGRPSAGSSATTDDRGIYRAYGLPPGTYIVMAAVTPTGGAGRGAPGLEDIRRLSAVEIQRAIDLARTGRANASGPAGQSPDRASERRVNYVPVFYPDTTDVARATAITIAAGEERGGVDLQIQLVTTARIDGTVAVPGNVKPNTVTVTLTPAGAQADLLTDVGGRLASTGRVDANGRFQIAGVAPGQYHLTAAINPALTQSLPADSPVRTLWGRTEVAVDGVDVTATLDLQPGVSISGRVVFDGGLAPPKDLAGGRVFLIPPGAGANLGAGPSVNVNADGTFLFNGVTPGDYKWINSVNWPGWSLRSSVANKRDAYDAPLVVKPGENVEWILTFTDKPTELSGVLQDATGRPAPDYFIIVFPTDRTFWTPASRRVRTTRPATDGKYSTAGLPPGDYHIAALTDVEQGEWHDPRFLDALVPGAVQVTLKDGERRTQDLRIR
jgi:hypothetical protein